MMGVVSLPPFFLAEVDPQGIGDSLLLAPLQLDEVKGMHADSPYYIQKARVISVLGGQTCHRVEPGREC